MNAKVSISGISDEYWDEESNEMKDGWRFVYDDWGHLEYSQTPPTLEGVQCHIAEFTSVLAHLRMLEKELSARTI